MRDRYPCGSLRRREFMGTAALSMLGAMPVSAQAPASSKRRRCRRERSECQAPIRDGSSRSETRP